MHDRLAHCYFDTSHAIVAATVSDDLPEFQCAVRRLLQMVDDDSCAAPPRWVSYGSRHHRNPERAMQTGWSGTRVHLGEFKRSMQRQQGCSSLLLSASDGSVAASC